MELYITELSKYLICFLMIGYVAVSFLVFLFKSEEERAGFYIFQNILMLMIQLLCFLQIETRTGDMAYLFFYRPVQPSAGYPVTIDDLLKPVRRNVVLVNPYNIPSECAKIILQTAVVKSHFLQAL